MIHYDSARGITDPNALIETEVFADRLALARQNAQSEVAAVLKLIDAGTVRMAPEWEVYEVASAEWTGIWRNRSHRIQ